MNDDAQRSAAVHQARFLLLAERSQSTTIWARSKLSYHPSDTATVSTGMGRLVSDGLDAALFHYIAFFFFQLRLVSLYIRIWRCVLAQLSLMFRAKHSVIHTRQDQGKGRYVEFASRILTPLICKFRVWIIKLDTRLRGQQGVIWLVRWITFDNVLGGIDVFGAEG